jgi:tetratricopeptide (TPR) repeat protein
MADKPKRKLKTDAKAKDGDFPTLAVLLLGGLVFLGVVFGFTAFFITSQDTTVIVSEVAGFAEATSDSAASLQPYDRGVVYLSEGRFLAAADAFTEALEANADNVDARYGRARAYHGVGDFDAALADYNRLLSDDPDYGYSAWAGLGDLYWEQYQRTDDAVHLPDALAAVEQAITVMEQADEAVPMVYRLAGTVQDQLGNADAALRHYQNYRNVAPVPSPVIESRIVELQGQ